MPREPERKIPATIGKAIRTNRLRSGKTQVQLAATISRTGKYISEVETGRTRLSEADLNRIADALGVTADKLLEADPAELEQQVEELPRRIRESQPSGLTLFTFGQLIDYLDRAGWLRDCTAWNLSAEAFPEENDVALVEQLAELVTTRSLQLCYVFPRQQLTAAAGDYASAVQGTRDVLPVSLLSGLRWSAKLRKHMEEHPGSVVGYALDEGLPFFSALQSYLWIQTARASWSEVMPLLYGRSETRTHENSRASEPFWYHVPRVRGSRMVITLGESVKTVDRKPVGT